MTLRTLAFLLVACAVLARNRSLAESADLIIHHGKIVTVDGQFRIAAAMAVAGERIQAVGSDEEVLRLAGPKTQQIDLKGATVLPGLIDSHAHPPDAAVYEFDHPVPAMESIADVLAYVKARAQAVPKGEWIDIQQVFVTRLREKRFPTRQELDSAALPDHPVMFRTGPDAALNSLALKASGIGKDFAITDGQSGQIERDPATGEPTGIVRNGSRFIKFRASGKTPSAQDRVACLKSLLAAYNEVGITGVTDRYTTDSSILLYEQLRDRGELTCRVFLTYFVDAQQPLDRIEAAIRRASHPLHERNSMLWLRGLKIFLDGGMLTGSAYMRQPWGVSSIYSITDPTYRGLLFVEPDRLARIAAAALRADLQLTAHAVGDGAVHALIDAYARVNAELPVGQASRLPAGKMPAPPAPIRELRPCISHCNFMSPEAIEKMRELGIVADLQPAWLYLDGATLRANFGDGRLAWFQRYKTLFERGVVVGGGSDHMQKIGRRRSINTYDPFLGMWTVLTRQPRWTDQPLHPEQCISREQAIRLYTSQNAYLIFAEAERGSLEAGKLADFIVLDRDILTCPLDEVKDIEVKQTWLGGKRVYAKP